MVGGNLTLFWGSATFGVYHGGRPVSNHAVCGVRLDTR